MEAEIIEQKRILEALLFAAKKPMSAQELHERIPNDADIGMLLTNLKSDYEGRGVNLVEIDNKWAFRTSEDLKDALILEKQVSKKLSRAAMEVLAIIAYHQPVTRADIENIRGVATGKGTIDVLMELGWIKPGKRR